MDKDWEATHALPGVQVNLIKNPTISKNVNFPTKKKCSFFAIWTENVLRKDSQF